jgi:hypothetical protein
MGILRTGSAKLYVALPADDVEVVLGRYECFIPTSQEISEGLNLYSCRENGSGAAFQVSIEDVRECQCG